MNAMEYFNAYILLSNGRLLIGYVILLEPGQFKAVRNTEYLDYEIFESQAAAIKWLKGES